MVSVITPCYNSGEFLHEAIDSVRGIQDIEIIIVDDGSTDALTKEYLLTLSQQGITVLYQENKGPAAARNTGVRASSGEYLLFLDSDNKIKPEYIPKALAVLNKSPEVGVVYAKPVFFGDVNDEEERYESTSFSFDRLLIGNYIDMCSVMRRQAWDDVSGFDENNAVRGCEDWDIWLRVAGKGWQFHLIDEPLYYYRVRNDSVSTTVVGNYRSSLVNYISQKHHEQIFKRYKYYARLYRKVQQKPFLFFLKFIYSKYILRKDYLPE